MVLLLPGEGEAEAEADEAEAEAVAEEWCFTFVVAALGVFSVTAGR